MFTHWEKIKPTFLSLNVTFWSIRFSLPSKFFQLPSVMLQLHTQGQRESGLRTKQWVVEATRSVTNGAGKTWLWACMKPSFGATLCLTNFWFIDHTQTRPFLFNWGLSAWYTNGTVRKSGRCLPKSWCNTSVPDVNASSVTEGIFTEM